MNYCERIRFYDRHLPDGWSQNELWFSSPSVFDQFVRLAHRAGLVSEFKDGPGWTRLRLTWRLLQLFREAEQECVHQLTDRDLRVLIAPSDPFRFRFPAIWSLRARLTSNGPRVQFAEVYATSTLLFDAVSTRLALGAAGEFDLQFEFGPEGNVKVTVDDGTSFLATCSTTGFHIIVANAAHEGLLSNIRVAPPTMTVRIESGTSELVRDTIRTSRSPLAILAAYINPIEFAKVADQYR